MTRTRPLRTLLFSAAIALVLAGCSAAGEPATSVQDGPVWQSEAPAPPALPAGWDPSTGVIALGDGPARVDVWFDPMCPYCKQFEEAQRGALVDWSTHEGSQVVLHPMTFLDRVSDGTAYSTRAATVLAAAAEQDTDAVLPVLVDLYDHQPDEHTAGLDDGTLLAIAAAHGVDATAALTDRPWDATFRDRSAGAFDGPDAITGTPTVRVDGRVVPSGELYEPGLGKRVSRYLDRR